MRISGMGLEQWESSGGGVQSGVQRSMMGMGQQNLSILGIRVDGRAHLFPLFDDNEGIEGIGG